MEMVSEALISVHNAIVTLQGSYDLNQVNDLKGLAEYFFWNCYDHTQFLGILFVCTFL